MGIWNWLRLGKKRGKNDPSSSGPILEPLEARLLLDADLVGTGPAFGPPSQAEPSDAGIPEITVLGNGVSITDGDTVPATSDHTDFGTVVEGGTLVSRIFTVRNDGQAPLLLGPVTLPTGFTLIRELADTLAPDASDTFRVALDASVVGTKTGDISIPTNDPDEDPFNFRITGVVRALMDGDRDLSFGQNGKVITAFGDYEDSAGAVAIQSDGKIVVVGTSSYKFAVARYNADGTLDTSFSGDGKVTTDVGSGIDYGHGVAIQSDGKIIVVGYCELGGNEEFAVVRYNADGSLDTSFDGDGRVITGIGSGADHAYSVAVQADGRIVVAGYSYEGARPVIAVVRYNPDGSLDASFDADGKVKVGVGTSSQAFDLAIQPNGKIVVVGNSSSDYKQFAVVRLHSDGTLDTSFDVDGKVVTDIGPRADHGRSVAIQSDGKIVVAGYAYSGSDNDFAVARYNPDGSLDTSFHEDGKAITPVGTDDDRGCSVAIQSDGKIVVVGTAWWANVGVVRYNSDGSLDASWGGGGKVITDLGSYFDEGRSVAIQSDGKLVVAGETYTAQRKDFALVRYINGVTVMAEVTVLGNGRSILDGDSTPSTLDHTDFGVLTQNGAPVSRTFVVRNDGTDTLTLGSVVVPAGFTVTEDLVGSLAPGASDTFTVRLETTALGTKSGQVAFATSDVNVNPFNFAVTGTVVVAPDITVMGNFVSIESGDTTPDPADFTDFGTAIRGASGVSRAFWVRNDGGSTLTIASVSVPAGFTLTQPAPASVEPGVTGSFVVRLDTATAGMKTGTVVVRTNDPDEDPFVFTITGTVLSPQPDVTVTGNGKSIGDGDTTPRLMDHTDFGSTTQGGATVSRVFAVRNDGSATLTLGPVSVPTGFTLVHGLDGSLAPGASDLFAVRLDTAVAGTKTGDVTFTTNDSDENPFNFRITGVVRAGDTVPQAVPYSQTFAAGLPTDSQGWEYYSDNQGRIQVIGGRLQMDDTHDDETYSLNEAVLHVDLSGQTGVSLIFDHWNLSDENTPLPTSFTGHVNGDGVALSVDGFHWVKVADLAGNFLGQSFALDAVIAQAQTAAGATDLSNVRIKFQQSGSRAAPEDGRQFENVRVAVIVPDTTAPEDVSGFAATAGDGQVNLTWTNPGDADFAGVRVVRKTGSAPTGPTDGTAVYQGTGTSTTDSGLTNGTVYYYRAFTFDEVPNYSSGTMVSAMPHTSTTVAANLAEGKSATQSSTYKGVGAERAVDGNTDGVIQNGSVTHTKREAQPWWEVDLGGQSEIDAIEIWNRMDACSDRLSDFYVFVSETPFTSGTVAGTLAQAGVWHEHVTIEGGPAPSIQLTAGTTGRYVRVQLAGTDCLSLAEVKVLGRQTVVIVGDNLAEGKSATQSSTYLGVGAERAVDGNTDGVIQNGSVTHTKREAQPWWEVDLGGQSEIDAIEIWNRMDACSDRLSDFYVFVSETPFTSSTVAGTLAQTGVWHEHVTIEGGPTPSVQLTAGTTGRYVRVQLAGTDCLSLAEVKVLGRQTVVIVGDNLAEGKSATQSSTYLGVGAERAVDGNTDGVIQNGSVTHTKREAQPWWEVDLGGQSEIDAIEIWNRMDACSDRLSDFYVFVSETPFTSGTVSGTLAQAGVWHEHVTIEGGPAPSIQLTAGTTGRYVRVQLAGTDCLSLAEVKVLGRQTVVIVGDNLAEGKSATQSSTYLGVGAERAVDGNTDGVIQNGSVTHTKREAQPWWEVDLGGQSEIDAIEIWNRMDACSDRLSDFYVFVSEMPFAGDTVAETLAQAGVWHEHVTIEGGPAPSVQLTAGTTGRYVRVQLAGTDCLSLAEVKVLGRVL